MEAKYDTKYEVGVLPEHHWVEKLHHALQDVGKKHGLDDFEKIKEEGILEQVISNASCRACKTTMVTKAAVLLSP